jgi:hypothetical protein
MKLSSDSSGLGLSLDLFRTEKAFKKVMTSTKKLLLAVAMAGAGFSPDSALKSYRQ